MPGSSGAPTGRCAACGPISAGSSATGAQNQGRRSPAPDLRRAAIAGFSRARHARTRGGGRSIRCTRPRSKSSESERRIGPTSSASRSRWRPRSPARRVAVPHGKALHRNPTTAKRFIPEIAAQIGANLSRIVADCGYRCHNAPSDHQLKVYVSGQKRGLADAIKRDPGAPRSNPSSATPKQTTEGAATSSRGPPPTPCSPLPATTSATSWPGLPHFGASSSRPT